MRWDAGMLHIWERCVSFCIPLLLVRLVLVVPQATWIFSPKVMHLYSAEESNVIVTALCFIEYHRNLGKVILFFIKHY